MRAVLATLEIRRDREERVDRQIEDFLEANIRSGRLRPGTRFPTMQSP